MNRTRSLIVAVLCMGVLLSCSRRIEKYGNYFIDKDVESDLVNKISRFQGATITSMDMKIVQNDQVIFNSYEKDKLITPCLIYSELDKGIISIDVYAEPFSGPGYSIQLFKDSCVIRHIVQSGKGEDIYKLNKQDPLKSSLSMAPEKFKLTLASKPTFKKGDIVEGIVELTAPAYYVMDQNKVIKYNIELTGYFKTDPLDFKENKGQSIFKE